MLDNQGFDLWADGYDASVQLSEESDAYPFAGYKNVLNFIYQQIRKGSGTRVLDIGFGTGVLTEKLYRDGYTITGIDFSRRMIEIARQKMPEATLLCHDFSQGLPASCTGCAYDAIVSTYAIHHLTDDQKAAFIFELKSHLAPNGKILIGDVSFPTREELEACRKASAEQWDPDEIYFVADELCPRIPASSYQKLSHCAGVLIVSNETPAV